MSKDIKIHSDNTIICHNRPDHILFQIQVQISYNLINQRLHHVIVVLPTFCFVSETGITFVSHYVKYSGSVTLNTKCRCGIIKVNYTQKLREDTSVQNLSG